MATGGLYIGTSGWTYADWRGRFYPPRIKRQELLAYYAGEFPTTEINYSFYHLPKPSTFRNWAARTPEPFVFAVKASRFITHIKRLNDVEDAWRAFLENAAELGTKLGPILLQLPPSFQRDTERLAAFLDLPRPRESGRLAFEFRHASWFDPEVLDLLRRHRAAAVIAQSERYPEAPHVPTAPFLYLRFHGPGPLFSSRYSVAQLEPWATRIREWLKERRDVYAYFNNDFQAYAVANARTLRAMVTGKTDHERG